MRFSRDLAGNLTMVPDTGDADGMQVYFVRANATMGDKYSFGNSQFDYGVTGWETKESTTFDYKKIKHAPLHSVPSGSFAKDSKDKLFYVNRDRSFYPIQEKHKEELNFSEDKVYNLSPDEEINVLPGAIDHSKFPVIERYNREASMSDFNYWGALKEEMGVTVKKKVPEFLGRVETGIRKGVKEAPGKLWKSTKEAWKKGGEREKPQVKETPSWGLEEVKPVDLIEKGKEFLKTFTPKY